MGDRKLSDKQFVSNETVMRWADSAQNTPARRLSRDLRDCRAALAERDALLREALTLDGRGSSAWKAWLRKVANRIGAVLGEGE